MCRQTFSIQSVRCQRALRTMSNNANYYRAVKDARPALKNRSVMEEVVSLLLAISSFACTRTDRHWPSSLRKPYLYAACTVTCEEHGTQGCPDGARAERVSDFCQDR